MTSHVERDEQRCAPRARGGGSAAAETRRRPNATTSAAPGGGGAQAVADRLHVPTAGPVAKAVARGYHLAALPAGRLRVAVTADRRAGRAATRPVRVPVEAIRLGDADRIADDAPWWARTG